MNGVLFFAPSYRKIEQLRGPHRKDKSTIALYPVQSNSQISFEYQGKQLVRIPLSPAGFRFHSKTQANQYTIYNYQMATL
jgi:hypothetical protein